ncbi:MAG: hypothetical protein QXM75_00095 [Candidatus Diapherotrites archaeon]
MSLFKKFLKIFFRARREKTLKMSVENAKKRLSDLRNRNRALKEEIPRLFSEIREELAELRKLVGELEFESPEMENVHFKKVVQTSKKDFVRKALMLLDKLEPPLKINVTSVKRYYENANKEIERSIFSSRKNISYASVGLPKHMRAIGQNFDSISKRLQTLGSVISENKDIFSEVVDIKISDLEKVDGKIKELNNELKELDAKIAPIEAELQMLNREISLLMESKEAKTAFALIDEKKNLEEKKAKIKDGVVSELTSLRRMLKKFENLCKKGGYELSHDVLSNLEKMIRNSELLLKADPKGESIKQVLKELKHSIETRALPVKEEEVEIYLKRVDNLLAKDFFSDFFWPLNEIDARIIQIDKELKDNTTSTKIADIKQEISRLEREISSLKLSREKIYKSMDLLNEELKRKAEELSVVLSEIFCQKVLVEVH